MSLRSFIKYEKIERYSFAFWYSLRTKQNAYWKGCFKSRFTGQRLCFPAGNMVRLLIFLI